MTKTELQVALAAATETNKRTAGVFLDTTPEKLKQTVEKVGVMASEVRKALGK